MFSPAKMTRLGAVLLKSDARAALRSLGAAGTLELAESRDLPGSVDHADAQALHEVGLLAHVADNPLEIKLLLAENLTVGSEGDDGAVEL